MNKRGMVLCCIVFLLLVISMVLCFDGIILYNPISLVAGLCLFLATGLAGVHMVLVKEHIKKGKTLNKGDR